MSASTPPSSVGQTPPTPPASPEALTPLPSPVGAPPRRSRTPLLLAVAVVVVVIGVVLALALAGVLPFLKLGPGNGGGPTASFGSSRPAAQAAADRYPGGPWQLFGAFGLANKSSATYPFANLTSSLVGTGCVFTPATGAPTTVTLTGTATVAGGESNSWVFLFKNSAGSSILLVSDLSATASALGTMGGSGCFGGLLGLVGTVGSNVIDSTQAATTVNAAGGSSFLAAHPDAFAAFYILAGFSVFGVTSPATWNFTYSACPFSATASGSAPEFSATVDATTGALLHADNSTVVCSGFSGNGSGGGGGAVGGALTLGTPVVANHTVYWVYNVSVVSAASGLALDNLAFSITTAGGTPVSVSAYTYVGVYTGGNLPVALFYFSSGSWSLGGTMAVTNVMTFSLLSNQYLGTDTLVVDGVGSFSGQVAVTLPAG